PEKVGLSIGFAGEKPPAAPESGSFHRPGSDFQPQLPHVPIIIPCSRANRATGGRRVLSCRAEDSYHGSVLGSSKPSRPQSSCGWPCSPAPHEYNVCPT